MAIRILALACAVLAIAGFRPPAIAQGVQWEQLDRLYSSLPPGRDDPAWRIDNLTCLGEHVCALGGKAGERWNCDSRVKVCVGQWRDGRAGKSELWDLFDCSTFLSDLNARQADLLRNPRFCEAPPPAKALMSTYDDDDIRCLSDTWCRDHTKMTQQQCTARIEKCSGPLTRLTVSERNSCRASRRINTQAGRCGLKYKRPVWLDESEWTPPPSKQTPAPVSPSTPPSAAAPPRTWQEQADRATARADAEAEDEFSLGDLDF